MRPGVTSSPVPAAVNPRFTNLPPDKVHDLILPTALKEKQNQFQKPSSVSLTIKPILLKNELQDENTLHVHNASSEQRSHSTSSFRSDTVPQSCQLDKDHQTCCSCSRVKNERISTGKRQNQKGKELMLCREYSLGGGGGGVCSLPAFSWTLWFCTGLLKWFSRTGK